MGIFGGMISADMTVPVRIPRIQRLEDIFDPQFNSTPVYLKQLYIYDRLDNSIHGSLEKKVIQRAIERRSEIIIGQDFGEEGKEKTSMENFMDRFVNAIVDPGYVFLDHDVYMKKILKVICIGRDIQAPIFSVAEKSFGKDLFTYPYSSLIPRKVRKRATQFLRRIFEAGTFEPTLDRVTKTQMEAAFTLKESPIHQECASFNYFKHKELYDKLHPMEPNPLDFRMFHGPLYLIVIAFIFGSISLLIEYFIYYFKN